MKLRLLSLCACILLTAPTVFTGAQGSDTDDATLSFSESRFASSVQVEIAERIGEARNAPDLLGVLAQIRKTKTAEIEYVGFVDTDVEIRVRATGVEAFLDRMRSHRLGAKCNPNNQPCVPTDPAPGDTVTVEYEDYWANARWRVGLTYVWLFDSNVGRYRWVVTDAYVQYLGPWGQQPD